MKTKGKPFVALAAAAILVPGLMSPCAQAQSTLIESGTSTMPDVLQQTGSEALTVSWFVVENNASGVYTYAYNVNNPAGDEQENSSGVPIAGTSETFDNFSLSFNTTLPGAYVNGTAPTDGSLVNGGANGLTWNFPAVSPGNSSELLAFQSDQPPVMGNASVSGGSVPPAPWSTLGNGQPVPVPRAVPEPEVTSLFAFAALLLPFRSWRRFFRKS